MAHPAHRATAAAQKSCYLGGPTRGGELYRLLIALTLIAAWPGAAAANPISAEVLRLRQVPQTTHVQITFASIEESAPQPAGLSRDGAPLDVQWISTASFAANTGSGLVGLGAWQSCDCGVAAGQREYVLSFSDASRQSWTTTMVVQESLETPPDAGAPATDLAPWDIPEPTQLQGLGCRDRCEAGAGLDAGPAVDAGSGGAGSDSGRSGGAAGRGAPAPARDRARVLVAPARPVGSRATRAGARHAAAL